MQISSLRNALQRIFSAYTFYIHIYYKQTIIYYIYTNKSTPARKRIFLWVTYCSQICNKLGAHAHKKIHKLISLKVEKRVSLSSSIIHISMLDIDFEQFSTISKKDNKKASKVATLSQRMYVCIFSGAYFCRKNKKNI